MNFLKFPPSNRFLIVYTQINYVFLVGFKALFIGFYLCLFSLSTSFFCFASLFISFYFCFEPFFNFLFSSFLTFSEYIYNSFLVDFHFSSASFFIGFFLELSGILKIHYNSFFMSYCLLCVVLHKFFFNIIAKYF